MPIVKNKKKNKQYKPKKIRTLKVWMPILSEHLKEYRIDKCHKNAILHICIAILQIFW